jgi:HAD superfamily hydrolase (TIGR01509 family)
MKHLTDGIKLVVFDMDGVLFDTERWAIDAWQQAGRMFGHAIPDHVIVQCIGLAAEDTEVLLRAHFGTEFPYEDIKAERLRIGREQAEQLPPPIKPGARELLEHFRGTGMPCALATSTDRTRVELLLGRSHLAGFFGVVVCREDVTRRKPWPDVFLEAALRAKVATAHCLVIEDSDTGITAAHRAGMRVVFVEDLKPLPPETAQLTVAAFRSLVELRASFVSIE